MSGTVWRKKEFNRYWECARCDVVWECSYGEPEDNDMNYCPKCGSPIERFIREGEGGG